MGVVRQKPKSVGLIWRIYLRSEGWIGGKRGGILVILRQHKLSQTPNEGQLGMITNITPAINLPYWLLKHEAR